VFGSYRRTDKLKKDIIALEDERDGLTDDNRKVKDELAELKQKRKMEDEDIRHLVKLKESKLDLEYEQKKVVLEREQHQAPQPYLLTLCHPSSNAHNPTITQKQNRVRNNSSPVITYPILQIQSTGPCRMNIYLAPITTQQIWHQSSHTPYTWTFSAFVPSKFFALLVCFLTHWHKGYFLAMRASYRLMLQFDFVH